MTLTLILIAIGATLAFVAIRSLRAQRLKERYALLFVFLGVPFFALAAWPDAVGYLAATLGIEYPTVLLLTVTTFFLFMNFKLLAIVSGQEQRIAELAQIIGILTMRRPEADASAPAESESTDATGPLPLVPPEEADATHRYRRGA